jgi:ribosome-associated heat shock protein Hsp15
VDEPVRIDRWLWAARLVKTRALAVDAVKGGHVEVNGQRVKPSRDVRPGDRLELTLAKRHLVVDVRATALRRGPASEAALLYEETAESRAAREQAAAEARLEGERRAARGGARPTKRDRRRMDATRGRR